MLGKPAGPDTGRAEQPVARLIGAAALLTGAALHLEFVPGYALPVLDGLFTASAAGMVVGAVLLIAPSPTSGLADRRRNRVFDLGYVLTRTTGLPGILSAVGAWFYPLGIPSLIVEAITFCLAVWAFRSTRTEQRPAVSRSTSADPTPVNLRCKWNATARWTSTADAILFKVKAVTISHRRGHRITTSA